MGLRDIIAVPQIGDVVSTESVWESMRRLGFSREDMAACEQHAEWHGEGDVAIHTEMALRALVTDEAWQMLDEQGRLEVYTAVMLHDVGKPRVTTLDEGVWRAPGHSGRGEKMARAALWRAGVDFYARERICAMIRFHLHPVHVVEREDPRYNVLLVAENVACSWLGMVARADTRGRICDDQGETLLGIEMFETVAEEQGCAMGRYEFASGRSRYEYFRNESGMRDPSYKVYDGHRPRMTLLVGLPGTGKSRWASLQDEYVISLDHAATHAPGKGKAQWRNGLRDARNLAVEEFRGGRNVVIDATNLTREGRRAWCDLAARYEADVRMVVFEEAPDVITARLTARGDRRAWKKIVADMCERWETPSTAECTELVIIGS